MKKIELSHLTMVSGGTPSPTCLQYLAIAQQLALFPLTAGIGSAMLATGC